MGGWMDGWSMPCTYFHVLHEFVRNFQTHNLRSFLFIYCAHWCSIVFAVCRVHCRLTHTHTHSHSLADIFRVCAPFSAALLLKWCKKCQEKAHRKCVLVMCAITSEIAISFAFMNSSIFERLRFRQFHCFHFSRSRSLTAEKWCTFGVGRRRRPQKKI